MQTTLKFIFAFIICIFSMFRAYAQTTYPPMTGFVDMHCHPRGDLAYGTQLFYGAPCGDISAALGNCKPDHGSNILRAVLARQTEQQNCKTWKDGKAGYPNFATWPSWCSILHQQMWVDWIERAHRGGLNVMVALAVSSHTIASAARTKGPQDDEQVMLNCIQGIKDLVAKSTFMEIALTPQDVRRIVASGKLAVILGSEMDNIGNFYSPQDHYKATFNPNPSDEQIQAELDKLWDLGIRYIFPVHLNNTVFGGTAIFLPTLNVANKFVTGAEWVPEQVSTSESGIAFNLQHPGIGLDPIAKLFMPFLLPKNVNPGRKKNYTFWDTIPGYGHRNSLGLTDRGRSGIIYMMKKGFLIDIDHTSEKMANEVLDMAIANDYPVNSGHNSPRGKAGNEGGRTLKQYAQLKQVGGMIGMGHGINASDFVSHYKEVAKIMDYSHVAIGTDVGGFSPLPRHDTSIHLVYDSTFTRCTTGNRTWDINIDGVAHYGLLSDYVRSWTLAGMTAQEMQVFMSSAEHFTEMWEKCEARKSGVK
jgi:microsomal dipeptidase-like Zn-dependent dipeptidase